MKWPGVLVRGSEFVSAALAVSLLAILIPGCQSANKPNVSAARGGKYFAVTADSAPFFHHGPQAGRAPDLKLPKDTLVRLIRPSFGYSKIQLVASGEQGYVLSDEIKPASPPLIAAALVAPANSAGTPSVGRFNETFEMDSSDPRLVPPPEQLPDPDLPAPAPEP